MNKKIIALGALACLAAAGCRVQETQKGKAPDIDLNVSGGQLPEYNVQGPNVSVGTSNQTVEVPTVETVNKTIEVPKIKVTTPGDKGH